MFAAKITTRAGTTGMSKLREMTMAAAGGPRTEKASAARTISHHRVRFERSGIRRATKATNVLIQ